MFERFFSLCPFVLFLGWGERKGVYCKITGKSICVIVKREVKGGIPRKSDLVGHLMCTGNEDEKRDRLHYCIFVYVGWLTSSFLRDIISF